jgi:hypothetical protein
VALASGRSIRIVTAAVFLATKLKAFRCQGHGDFFFSHDREAPHGRGRRPGISARRVQTQASQQRLPDLLETLRSIAALAEP